KQNQNGAADYPKKQIQVIVPAGPGGDTDLNARMIGKYLEKELGQNIVISNVKGAGGATGTEKAYNSKADGYHVFFFHNSTILGKMLGISKYDYSDFKLAGVPAQDTTTGYFVSTKSKYQSLKSLISAAKENPGKITVA